MERIIGDREIGGPRPGKPPLKVNVFHALRSANTSLMPIFPYTGDGDLVPGASILWGGENRDSGVFNHENSVDEVAITVAASKSRLRAGFVHVGARKHLVGRYFEDPTDPGIMMAIIVTQRQADRGVPQSETLTFICDKCQEPLLTHDHYAAVDPEGQPVHLPGFHPPLETITEGAIALEPFNNNVEARTCPKCGNVNDKFPLHVWGWDRYYKNTVAAERGRAILAAAGAES
jgi:hypothetical protein